MQKTTNLVVLTLAVLAAGGCQTFRDIDTAAGQLARRAKAERATGTGAQHAGRMSGAMQAGGCRRVSQALRLHGIDPDSVYVRLKRYFGYLTPREAETAYANPEWLPYTKYRHVTLPGVRYSLSQDIDWPSRALGRRHAWLNMEIEREGRDTIVRWNHCIDTDGWEGGDPAAVKDRLARDIERAATGGRR